MHAHLRGQRGQEQLPDLRLRALVQRQPFRSKLGLRGRAADSAPISAAA